MSFCFSLELANRGTEARRASGSYSLAIPGSDSRLGMDGPVRAEDVFKSIEIFKGKPATQVLIAMNAISGNLGVSCTYCHTQFEWEKNDKPAKGTTRKMFRMIAFIDKNVFPRREQGKLLDLPSRPIPSQVAYPKDAPIKRKKSSISAEEKNKPAEQVFHNIQSLKGVPAGRMPLIMDFFANSLGVRCSALPRTRPMGKRRQGTKKKARKMLGMVLTSSPRILRRAVPLAAGAAIKEK